MVIEGSSSQKAEVDVFDAIGRLIKRFDIDLVEGEVRNEIPVSKLPGGTYLLLVRVGSWEQIEKLVVVH